MVNMMQVIIIIVNMHSSPDVSIMLNNHNSFDDFISFL